jgi:predicted TIM-barrel fold metal-dependent hydrolase
MRDSNMRWPSGRAAWSRRDFLSATGLAVAATTLAGCATAVQEPRPEPVIDIHQHLGYSGRPDAVLVAHQRAMGVTLTVLLPAGRPSNSASTHFGVANGLQARALGVEACYEFACAHGREYRFAANEVPDLDDATRVIERYLRRGAVMIGEQKFGVDCDSPAMQRIYELARDFGVPVLMHWQFGMYNHGFDRFHRMLEKFPTVNFIGHAQTWWAHIDKAYRDDPKNLYPKGPVTPGGLTDRYLSDYPNLYGDLSAGSGLNALTRDEAFTRDFLRRHQDKLLYGSDCNDHTGREPECQGAKTLAAIRRLAPDKTIERKLLYENAKKLLRL